MEVAIKISPVIVEVSHSITPKESTGGTFFRLKITIDLSLPLCRGHLTSLENGKQTWVIRNSEGSVIVALLERVTLPPSMDDLVALAVTFAIELGLQEVIF